MEIDKELTFHSHVDKLCKKLSQRIGILKNIKHCLQIKHRVLFYNAIIRPVMDYVSVIWSNCDKHCLDRVLKLQKRAARIVIGADSYAPSVQLFNMLKWIPFFENAKLAKCCIIYKRLQGRVPSYLTNLLVLTGETHSRQTRYAKFNIACPRVNRNTEGGRTFTVTASLKWNKLPLQMRKAETLKTFKNSLWNRIFKDQQSLNHFSI